MDPLLLAIIKNPHDIDLRLVYADFIEEQGRIDRANLIRVECEICRIQLWDKKKDKVDLGKENVRLMDVCRNDFNHPGLLCAKRIHHSRGFISEIDITFANWIKHGPSLVKEHPLEKVSIKDREPNVYSEYEEGMAWFDDWSVTGTSSIGDLWYFLPPEDNKLRRTKVTNHGHPNKTGIYWIGKSTKEHMNDLSIAAIAWAQAEAGIL